MAARHRRWPGALRLALVSAGAVLAGGCLAVAGALPERPPDDVMAGGLIGSLCGALAVLVALRGRGLRDRTPCARRSRAAHVIRNKVTSLGLALDSVEDHGAGRGSGGVLPTELRDIMREDLDRLSSVATELCCEPRAGPRLDPDAEAEHG